MSGYAKFERPQLLRSASGLAYYESAAFIQGVEDVVNTDTVVIPRGCAVKFDAAGSFGFIPRWVYSTAGTDITFGTVCKICVKKVTSAAVGLIGVAMEDIPVNGTGRICTDGLVSVLAEATLCTVGHGAVGHATAGLVTGSASPTVGTCLGVIEMINTVATPGTGSTGEVLVRISPR
jgi:hypothetical protein